MPLRCSPGARAGRRTTQVLALAVDDYRVCPAEQTQIGLETVKDACGTIVKPDFEIDETTSLSDLAGLKDERDAFRQEVRDFGTCITQFINSYRRPGADASSTAPDKAACAHSWAEDQATESIREFGRSCLQFNDMALIKGEPSMQGACYPQF